jgi:hypothetical protein
MTWVKLDEDFANHPKVVEAGPLGIALQVAALCYCNRHLTDGHIPRAAARSLLDFEGLAFVSGHRGEDVEPDHVIGLVVDAGLWHEPDHGCEACPPVGRGYLIHDYLQQQPSREAVLAKRAQAAEAGRKGGQARKRPANRSASEPSSETLSEPSSETEADTQAEVEAESKPGPGPVSVPVVQGQTLAAGPVDNGHGEDEGISYGNDTIGQLPDRVVRAINASDDRAVIALHNALEQARNAGIPAAKVRAVWNGPPPLDTDTAKSVAAVAAGRVKELLT